MKINVADVLDDSRWTGYLSLLIGVTALAIVLDGMDNQLLGTAVPALMEEWKLPRSAFSTPLAMSPLGMMIGGAVGGWFGDRFGRRSAMLLSIFAFALPTAALYFANDIFMLGLLRLLAGLGLGGAMPNATALASEYVPRRRRPFAVTLIIVCVPVGAMLAAFLSARIIPAFGWRPLFLGGGLVPIVFGIVLYAILPESPQFLARRPHRWPELVRLLRRLGHTVDADATFTDLPRRASSSQADTMFRLFSKEFRRDTFALCSAFFFCLLVIYLALQLLVTALKGSGFDQQQASDILGWWNIGGIGGAIVGALIIQRMGSRTTMLALSAIAVLTAFYVTSLPIHPSHRITLLLICFVMGSAINAVQVALYALAAHVYPTEIRGRGLGTVLTVGRVGNVLASYVGIFALDSGGTSAYFAAFGIGMTFVFISIATVRRHIPRDKVD